MGVESQPRTLGEAVASYLSARDRLEGRFGVWVPRALEREVPGMRFRFELEEVAGGNSG